MFFFDLVGKEMVSAIEETRVSSSILEELNKTYLTLIPKVDRPLSFGDYRPNALCNLLYKLITNIIAGRLKEGLRKFILAEKFGFLPRRQIMDVAGIFQEAMHSIKLKHLLALIFKLYLENAYDKVDCSFLNFILV